MNEKFEQWIPWYVNGTLKQDERVEMDRYLANHAEARAEVATLMRAAKAMKSSAERVPADRGLYEVLARIDTEKLARRQAIKLTKTSRVGPWGAIRNWLGTSWTQPAFAVALTVIGVQSLYLFRAGNDEMQMRGAKVNSSTAGPAKDMAYLRVVFKPTATEGELRVLLGGNGVNFVLGPGDSGEYVLSVASKDSVRALQTLQGSNIVASVNAADSPK